MFGPERPIATKEACERVDGVFRPAMFGWMLHANVFGGEDAATTRGDDRGAHEGMMMPM